MQRYYHTLRHLQARQVYYQLWHRAKKLFSKPVQAKITHATGYPLQLADSIPAAPSYLNGTFTFLNKAHHFNADIDWNFDGYGKLWTYYLNYFEFLLQPDVDVEAALQLMRDYGNMRGVLRDGLEPYPISLRGVNWIKFFSYHHVNDQALNAILRTDYMHLAGNIEYHLMGNHLLENGFSLLFGAYYFRDDVLYEKARRILAAELGEQVLKDGAHFEKSPMYHQIILLRLTDCINLILHNPWKQQALLPSLVQTAEKMLGWLQAVTFKNGDVPLVNDATNGVAPTTVALVQYAKRLKLAVPYFPLSDSGYRMVRLRRHELFIDVGSIGPDYIPGHAHSDTFSFILYTDGAPVIVDTGTSTYERNTRRSTERSTAAHNTVMAAGQEQSDVWASFRVGRRARVYNLRETAGSIVAQHDGYNWMGLTHEREWQWFNDSIIISDRLEGNDMAATASFHFHPDVLVTAEGDRIYAGPIELQAKDHDTLVLDEYAFALGFNKTSTAQVARLGFRKNLTMVITPR